MPKTFNCPSCYAPLEFNNRVISKCRYCSAEIIAPPEVYQNEEFIQKQKMAKLDAVLKSVFSNMNTGGGNVQVIDFRNASPQEQNQNIADILAEVRSGREANAVKVFSQTYHVEGAEAEKVINAMKTNRGFNLSELNTGHNFVRPQKNTIFLVKIIIGITIFIFIISMVISFIAFLLPLIIAVLFS